ncbi:MAG: FAD-binding protein [Acidimicrobiales bacterium]
MTGWGRTSRSRATLITAPGPDDIFDVARAHFGSNPHLIARGLGRSYGDAAQCAGGVVIGTGSLDSIGQIDPNSGVVEVGAGVSLDSLLRVGLGSGWFIPVSPGTSMVSIGGAVAADVHGKNHHVNGSFCNHVPSVKLATPTGTFDVSPDRDSELFWATTGGMGLTGVVLSAQVVMTKVETSWMRVDTERHGNIDSLMAGLERADTTHRYSVAWVDCSGKGRRLGRGIVDAGDHASVGDLRGRQGKKSLTPPPPKRFNVPGLVPPRVINAMTIGAFNQAWYLKNPSRSGRIRHLSRFFYPLDSIGDWNRLYGKHGFIQYQFVVSDHHADLVQRSIDLLQGAGAPCSLAVLKRFGPQNPGPLSFPIKGWTLALDLAVGPAGLPSGLRKLDELVAEAGGRVYLAKDARLDRNAFRSMYPRLGEFEAVCDRVDPQGILRSDLSQRLGLREGSQ